jgi:hypothetical protein
VYYLLISFLTGLLTLSAGALTWADFIAITPLKAIERWEEQRTIIDKQSFDKVWDQLEIACRINPASADYLLGLGRLSLLMSKASMQDNKITYNHYRTLAVTYLQHALSKRPSSGLTWAYLAKSLSIDPNQSESFIFAMGRSATLEPYEELNQKQIIPLAIEHWNRLPNRLQESLKTIIRHGLFYQPREGRFIIEAAVKHNWGEELKGLIQKKWQRNYWNKLILQKTRSRI